MRSIFYNLTKLYFNSFELKLVLREKSYSFAELEENWILIANLNMTIQSDSIMLFNAKIITRISRL